MKNMKKGIFLCLV